MLQQRLNLALEAAEVGLWDYVPSASRLEWDARCKQIFGLPDDAEITHERFLALVHADDRGRVDDAVQAALESSTPFSEEYRIVRSDGGERWISARGSARLDENNKVTRMVGVVVDVTARYRESDERQNLSRDREEAVAALDTLLSQAPVGIGLWDLHLRYARVNRVLAEMNGLPAPAHHGHTEKELFPATGERIMQLLARVRDTGETITDDITLEGTPDKAERHWRVKYYPVTARGRCVGVGGICDEITQQKLHAQQLEVAHEGERVARTEAERLNRMKDEFLSTVSHELRTPLQSILGWARTLREGGLEPSQVAHGLMIIERNAHSQARIIEDLLDVSRVISGKLRIARHPVEMLSAVEFALDTIRPAALAKSIALSAAVEPDIGHIMADEDRIKQVLWNLLSNAVKFTPEGGSVSVAVSHAAGVVEIRVVDTGQGVRESFLPHVFERFRQQDGGTTRAQGGLGLGLAIVRHIVEMHGGTVRVESGGEGRGTTFIVRLPALAPPETEAPVAPPRESAAPVERSTPLKPLDGRRVLIVDDEEDARELLALVLRRNGAHTDAVGSVREALAQLERDEYDVVVSDIGMPEQDGYVLARTLRSHPRRPRVLVALTAYARAEDRRAALSSGFDGHAAKPIEPAELVQTLARHLGDAPPRDTGAQEPPT